jgi:cytochrome c oxidase assembly factor 2
MTMSLFTSTLAFSFLVVATPHLLPCPVDPRTLTDSGDIIIGEDGQMRRRRRRRKPAEEVCSDTMGEERNKITDAEEWKKPTRECPIPKPGGLIGKVLGIRKDEDEDDEEKLSVAQHIERAKWRRKPREGEQ